MIVEPCPRCTQLTCLAKHDALRRNGTLEGTCCQKDDVFDDTLIRFPREHVEAAMALSASLDKTVDYTFSGAMSGLSNSDHRRDWVREFALAKFTSRSVFVDTAANASSYRALGDWDHTAKRLGAALVPRNIDRHAELCGKSACDPAYLADLASAQFALAPAGDTLWSIRFFESVMTRAIPIVDDASHVGRNPYERALGYYFLLRSDVESMAEPLKYCAEWAERNFEIFLRHQAWDGASLTAKPSLAGCPDRGARRS